MVSTLPNKWWDLLVVTLYVLSMGIFVYGLCLTTLWWQFLLSLLLAAIPAAIAWRIESKYENYFNFFGPN